VEFDLKVKDIKRNLSSIVLILILIFSGFFILVPSTPFISSVEATSIWTLTSYGDFTNGTLNHTTIVHSGENAEIKLASGIWIDKTTSVKPEGVEFGSMAPVYGTDNTVLFSDSSETWIYDFGDNTWKKKSPSNAPSERGDFRMASIYGTHKVLLFGGRWGDIFYNETWIYDLDSDSWSTMPASNNPIGRNLHSLASFYNDDKILLFGGFRFEGGGHRHNDTWIYDYSNNTWTQRFPEIKPNVHTRHALASIYGTDKFILFSGQDHTETAIEVTWIYDYSDNTWTKKSPAESPIRRVNHAIASIYGTSKVLLFGGSFHEIEFYDDTWIYNYNDNSWTFINISVKPRSRHHLMLVTMFETESVLLYGGVNVYDTWIFEYSKYVNQGNFISSMYDTGARTSFKTISWNADIPAGTSIKIQLRTADNESNLLNNNFIGPDGTASNFYTSSPSIIWSGHYKDRFLQFKAFLSTNNYNETPVLRDLSIFYNNLPGTISIEPANGILISNNTPIFEWNFYDPNTGHQSAFQVLIDNDQNFNSVDYDSGEQSSTEQQWPFPEGTNYKTITDGKWYWKVRTKDNDDDWSDYSPTCEFKIDTMKPESIIRQPINNGFYNKMDAISGESFDQNGGTGINKVEIQIKRLVDDYYWSGSTWIPDDIWLLTEGTSGWVYDSSSIIWDTKTQYIIRSRAVDNVTNIEYPDNDIRITIDKDDPLSSIEHPINNGYINNLEVIYGNAGDANGSGVERVKIRIKQSDDNKLWSGTNWVRNEVWINVTGIDPWNYDTSGIFWTSDTNYVITSRAIDYLGNSEVAGESVSFMFDNQNPSHSIVINNNAEFTNSKKVTLSLEAEDSGSGIFQMQFSNDNITWSDFEPFNSTKTFNLSSKNGEKFIYFIVFDKANNTGIARYDTIILDTEPPRDLSIIINNDKHKTTSQLVTLRLHANDNISGVHQMSFCSDGLQWTSWEKYDDNKSFVLQPGQGSKNIYFRVKDRAGNIAKPVSDTIKLKSDKSNEYLFGQEPLTVYIIIVMITIISLILLVLYFMAYKKRKKLEDKKMISPSEIPPYIPPTFQHGITKDQVNIGQEISSHGYQNRHISSIEIKQPGEIPGIVQTFPHERTGKEQSEQHFPQLPPKNEKENNS
jgi:hypothetical protein